MLASNPKTLKDWVTSISWCWDKIFLHMEWRHLGGKWWLIKVKSVSEGKKQSWCQNKGYGSLQSLFFVIFCELFCRAHLSSHILKFVITFWAAHALSLSKASAITCHLYPKYVTLLFLPLGMCTDFRWQTKKVVLMLSPQLCFFFTFNTLWSFIQHKRCKICLSTCNEISPALRST